MQPRDDELLEDDVDEQPAGEDADRPQQRWWVRDEDAERMERWFAENCTRPSMRY